MGFNHWKQTVLETTGVFSGDFFVQNRGNKRGKEIGKKKGKGIIKRENHHQGKGRNENTRIKNRGKASGRTVKS